MADFCTRCAPEGHADINIVEEAKTIPDGQCLPVLCEGCGLDAIGVQGDKVVLHFLPSTHDGDDEEDDGSSEWWEFNADTDTLTKITSNGEES